MEKKDFGARLLSLRKEKGVSQADVAEYIGLTVAAYQNYENGRREAGYDTISKLADFYGVTADYLLGREPAPDPFADFNLDAESEKEVIDKYMSLPKEIRACLLDVLVQLGNTAQKRQVDESEENIEKQQKPVPQLMRAARGEQSESTIEASDEAKYIRQENNEDPEL